MGIRDAHFRGCLFSLDTGPDCGIRFHCCLRSPFASASRPAAAPRLRLLQLLLAARSRPLRLLLPDCVRLNCCSPDCVRFDCCSPIAAVRLNCCTPDCVRFDCCSPIAYPGPMFSNILRGVRGSVNKFKYEGRASL